MTDRLTTPEARLESTSAEASARQTSYRRLLAGLILRDIEAENISKKVPKKEGGSSAFVASS